MTRLVPVLLAGLLLGGPAAAQEPPSRPTSRPAAADPELREWLRILADRIAHESDAIRASAQAALAAVGAPAVPVLEELAGGDDAAAARAARKVLSHIRRRHHPRGRRSGRRSLESALEKLQLTAEQKSGIGEQRKLLSQRMRELGTQRMDGELDHGEYRHARWKALRRFDASLKKILTPEQHEALQKHLKKMREPRGRRGKGPERGRRDAGNDT